MKGIDFFKMLKEAGKMQEAVKKRQDELAGKMFEATAGGGMVTAVVNGMQELISLDIEKNVVSDLGLDTAKTMILSAVNEALARAKEAAKADITSIIGDMGGMISGAVDK